MITDQTTRKTGSTYKKKKKKDDDEEEGGDSSQSRRPRTRSTASLFPSFVRFFVIHKFKTISVFLVLLILANLLLLSLSRLTLFFSFFLPSCGLVTETLSRETGPGGASSKDREARSKRQVGAIRTRRGNRRGRRHQSAPETEEPIHHDYEHVPPSGSLQGDCGIILQYP